MKLVSLLIVMSVSFSATTVFADEAKVDKADLQATVTSAVDTEAVEYIVEDFFEIGYDNTDSIQKKSKFTVSNKQLPDLDLENFMAE